MDCSQGDGFISGHYPSICWNSLTYVLRSMMFCWPRKGRWAPYNNNIKNPLKCLAFVLLFFQLSNCTASSSLDDPLESGYATPSSECNSNSCSHGCHRVNNTNQQPSSTSLGKCINQVLLMEEKKKHGGKTKTNNGKWKGRKCGE